MQDWLITGEPLTDDAVRHSVDAQAGGSRDLGAASTYAVRVRDISLERNTWATLLGGPDARLDVLAIGGNFAGDDLADCAFTVRYPSVGSGNRLPIDDAVLAYLGRPRHFLTLALIASGDRAGTPDLKSLLQAPGATERLEGTVKALNGAAAGGVDAVQAALTSAIAASDVALQALKAVCPRSIGLYRAELGEWPDRFRFGRNPPGTGVYRRGGLSMWYEVVDGHPAPSSGVQVRMVIAVDIVGYSRRTTADHQGLHTRLRELIDGVVADLPVRADGVDVQESGDGANVVLPVDVDYSTVLAALLSSVRSRLSAANAGQGDRMRLRMAVEVAMVGLADMGFVGDGLVTAGRLLDSAPIREVIAQRDDVSLAVMLSDRVYRDIVAQGYRDLVPDEFTAVSVDMEAKSFHATGWLLASTG